MRPVVYVCIVSRFNLAEFEACLTRKPQRIALIVSNGDTFARAAFLLRKLLKNRLENPEINIDVLDAQYTGHTLSGDDVFECQQWVQKALHPYLKRLELSGFECGLNFTGGTKAMSLALTTGYPWSFMDYKSSSRAELQVLKPFFEEEKLLRIEADINSIRKLEEATPMDAACLYAESFSAKVINPLADCSNTSSIALGSEIWEALSTRSPALIALFEGFENIWSKNRSHPEYRKEQLTLSWQQLLNSEEKITHLPEIMSWFKKLQSISQDRLNLTCTEQNLEIPGNLPRGEGKYWRNWVCGDWLEQLVYFWLQKEGIPDRAIARNLQIADQNNSNGSQREVDIMIHFQGKTSIIEVKADLPPDGELKDLETQVSSLGERFGMTHKALFIGPQLLNYSQEEKNKSRWKSFELRCKASNVYLYSTRNDLISWLRKS